MQVVVVDVRMVGERREELALGAVVLVATLALLQLVAPMVLAEAEAAETMQTRVAVEDLASSLSLHFLVWSLLQQAALTHLTRPMTIGHSQQTVRGHRPSEEDHCHQQRSV